MKFWTLVSTVAAAAVISAAAQAADASNHTDAGFSWNGLYAGLLAGGEMGTGGTSYVDGGLALGGLFSAGNDIVGGLELSGVLYTGSSSGYELDVTSRLGMLAGDVLIYGRAGIGTDDFGGEFSYGGGLWYAAADNVSLRGEVFGSSYFGSGTVDWVTAQAGLFYHFN